MLEQQVSTRKCLFPGRRRELSAAVLPEMTSENRISAGENTVVPQERWRNATGKKCSFVVNTMVQFYRGIVLEDGLHAFVL